MSRSLFSASVALLTLAAISFDGAPSAAATIIEGDTNSAAFLTSGFSLLEDAVIAEGRYGDSGARAERELVVGRTTAGDGNSVQHSWATTGSESFTYSFDGVTASWSLGGDSVAYAPAYTVNPTFNALVLRARADAEMGVSLTNMSINGVGIDDFEHLPGAGDNTARLLLLDGLGDLSSGFTITGEARLIVPSDAGRLGSRVAFQFKPATAVVDSGTTFNQPPTVPAPAAAGLLLAGVAVAVGLRRR